MIKIRCTLRYRLLKVWEIFYDFLVDHYFVSEFKFFLKMVRMVYKKQHEYKLYMLRVTQICFILFSFNYKPLHLPNLYVLLSLQNN